MKQSVTQNPGQTRTLKNTVHPFTLFALANFHLIRRELAVTWKPVRADRSTPDRTRVP